MRILVAGCGSIGKRHLRNLRALDETDLLVYRSTRQNVEAIEREFGVRSFFDLTEALAESDVVFISNPTSLHIPVALEAAKRERDLFIEKPVSHTMEGVEELAELGQAKGLVIQVGYNMRFCPVLKAAKQLVDDGRIGQVWGARAWASQYLPDWHPYEDYRYGYVARRELGGGVILSLGHELDYLRWMFGDVLEVTAWAGQPSGLFMDTESWADISLLFTSGITGQVHLDCLRRPRTRGLDIMGSDGALSCDIVKSQIVVSHGDNHQTEILVPAEDPNQSYVEEMAHFLGCVRDRAEPVVPLREGVETLKLALAALDSASEGRRLRLGE